MVRLNFFSSDIDLQDIFILNQTQIELNVHLKMIFAIIHFSETEREMITDIFNS